MEQSYKKETRPLISLFIIVTGLVIAFHNKLDAKNISFPVILSANALLFAITMINLRFQFRNINNPNPNAVVRGLIGGTFLKLFVLAAAVIIYLLASGENRSVNAVFVGMGLYVIYTWMEVKISLRLKPRS